VKQLFNVRELLKFVKENYQNPHALGSHTDKGWLFYSTEEFIDQVKDIALGLYKQGIRRDDKVAIFATPSARWTIVDFAVMSIGAVTVPIFDNISHENFLHIVNETGLKTLFIGNEERWNLHTEHLKGYFQRIILLDEEKKNADFLSYEELMNQGKELDQEKPTLFNELIDQVNSEDLATIIYTSGSTGIPKGAMHTHRSLISLIHTDLFQWDWHNDSYLSVLPLAHVYARTLNIILVAWGVSIYYFNNLKEISFACRDIHPTIMVVVPRLLEKVYGKMASKIEHAPFLARTIGRWAFKLANKDYKRKKGFLHKIADHLVYSHLRDAMGGNLRIIISGGAALDPHLYNFLLNIGLPVFEGWGLTEACPVTVNRPGKLKIGTIGLPVGDYIVKASPMSELLIHGSGVMIGYYKNPKATAEALDKDGWLHTGDRGFVDEEGFVTIRGRLKELLKTSTGEAIAPIPIEQELVRSPYIEMAMLVADNKKFVSALLIPDFEGIRLLKAKNNLTGIPDEEFLDHPLLKKEISNHIDQVNKHLSHWEQVREYRFIPHALTIDNGEITPSMKIIREALLHRYKDLIDSIYREEEL
jgi:long-chain acyl-CoA synthetase